MKNIVSAKTSEINCVKIEEGLFGRVTKLIREYVIPNQWEILNDRAKDVNPDHSIENFTIAAGDGEDFPSHCIANFKIAAGLQDGDFYGMVFQDSDLAKWLEAVSYSLMTNPDKVLEKTVDDVIKIIEMAQSEDGYLNTYFTIKEPGKRFTNLCECHELYCAGHMMEAAVAYFKATSKRTLLDVMLRMADCIYDILGPEDEGKLPGYPGHEEIELALVKMYRVTGKEKLLKLAKFFIDERGKKPLYFDMEFEKRNHESHFWYIYPPYGMYSKGQKYAQYHMPIREQKNFVGHAVRCMYMASGMVDVAVETDDETLWNTSKALFDNMINRRMYITGGIGSTPDGEMFTFDYDLPNDMVYGETCASIGLVFLAQRMLLVEQKSKYADAMERALFNTCIAGMSLDGKNFFYVNPLEVDPIASRENPNRRHVLPVRPAWFGCACCPPNLSRMISSLGEYLYVIKDNDIFVNLYMSNKANLETTSGKVDIDVKTNYPYDGNISLVLSKGDYSIHLRIPDWSRDNFEITVNKIKVNADVIDGYAVVSKRWDDGDILNLNLDFSVKRIHANPKVSKDVGKVAIQRGPLVYCLEEVDNGKSLQQIYLPKDSEFKVINCPDKLNGIVELTATGLKLKDSDEDKLYFYNNSLNYEKVPLTFIPYYSWANRGENEMTVWVHETDE